MNFWPNLKTLIGDKWYIAKSKYERLGPVPDVKGSHTELKALSEPEPDVILSTNTKEIRDTS